MRLKDRKEITEDFRKVYSQETEEDTKAEFGAFTKKWGITYPRLIHKLIGASGLFTYLDFPKPMWQSVMTSNAIESFNAELKRHSGRRILFNSETNETIVLTGCISDYNQSARKKREKYLCELSEEERYELGFDLLGY